MDHVSMHTEGTKSSYDVEQLDNQGIVAAIRDLQRSQATMWAVFQYLHQRTHQNVCRRIDSPFSQP